MQQILLSCEFLIAAASCNADQLDDVIRNLSEISSAIEEMTEVYLLEEDLLNKLTDQKKYPSERHFEKNIKSDPGCAYSAKDVVRLVNNILERCRSFDYMSEAAFDLIHKSLVPNFLPQSARSNELSSMLEGVALHNEFSLNPTISVLHKCAENNFKTTTFSATVIDTSEPHQYTLPHRFQRITRLDSDYKTFLLNSSVAEIESLNSTPEFKIRLAIYVESLKELRARNEPLDKISFKDIVLSPGFLRSLVVNSSGFSQPFFGTTLGVMAKLFSRSPTLEINYFFDSDGEKARTHGEYTAYRVHITKANQALRLLYWKNKRGDVVLANIGPKHELKIEKPV
ncbi:hypothetical protein [Herbaspirillum huttiense]|uniref:hypothetical protein n=1 Tax=Herbaspirillum huttiense TaxID=863372 RepID=UPI003CF7DD58